MTLRAKTKPFEISKREVFDAWKRVKANKGAAGVDKESIVKFEASLSRNLYKLWNRMPSGNFRLTLHPKKTRIVYCKDSARKGNYPTISYKFLGYTFQPRAAKNRKSGKMFTSFLPAASREAQKSLRLELRAEHLRQCVSLSIEEVAEVLNPMLRGWFNYFARFYASELNGVCYSIDRCLTRWARNKHRWSFRRSTRWLDELKCQQPRLFAHWAVAQNSHG